MLQKTMKNLKDYDVVRTFKNILFVIYYYVRLGELYNIISTF